MFDSRLRATAKIRLTLLLLFPIFIVEQIYFVALRHRFAKERYNFTIHDFVETKPADTFAKGIGGETINPTIEGPRNQIVIDFLVSVIGVRTILQTIHRVRELTEFGVSDGEFDFFQ